jgi:hypothetical protein
MLSVNVGFLAIPGMIPTNINNTTLPPTPSQIISYLSLISSVGSIVVGLLLIRHHRRKQEEDLSSAVSQINYDLYAKVQTFNQVQYLRQNDNRHFGLEPMAIVFSLPWALLMWAYVFLASQQ